MRAALANLADAAQHECGGRAVAADKVHVTLFFLGDVPRSRIAEIECLAREIRGSAFDIALDVLGYWRHNRIVWAGTRACPQALAALVRDLTGALSALGFRSEDRLYVPHVTLARNARRSPRDIGVTPIEWRVEEFALIESTPTGGAHRYDVVARWPLLV